MSQESSRKYVTEILARTSLSWVVKAHIPHEKVKGTASRLTAPCPFHQDKGNSLAIWEQKGLFHCSGCKSHGNAIDFLMRFHHIPFTEAAKTLGDHFNIPCTLDDLDEDSASMSNLPPAVRTLIEVQSKAAVFYANSLYSSEPAHQYLVSRGLTEDIIQRMEIGFAPSGWQSLRNCIENYDQPAMVESGLVVLNDETGKRYDRFRDRIIFPIRNEDGHVVGFGGRVILGGEPKYLNSPETPVFSKSNELYGLYQARKAIAEKGFVLVTEGYMDVVALHQLHWENSVATLGTATSESHVEKLLRHTRKIVYSFDGDGAGCRAAWRALEAALPYAQNSVEFRFLFLPTEHDPDSFIRAHGSAAFEVLIDNALTIEAFFVQEMRDRYRTDTLEGKINMLHDAVDLIRTLPYGSTRSAVISSMAKIADLSDQDINHLLGNSQEVLPGETSTLTESNSSIR